MHGPLLHQQPIGERLLPEPLAPIGQFIAAPDIVDEQIEAPGLLTPNLCEQRSHLFRHGMVNLHGDADAATCRYQFGSFLDRFGASRGGRPAATLRPVK